MRPSIRFFAALRMTEQLQQKCPLTSGEGKTYIELFSSSESEEKAEYEAADCPINKESDDTRNRGNPEGLADDEQDNQRGGREKYGHSQREQKICDRKYSLPYLFVFLILSQHRSLP